MSTGSAPDTGTILTEPVAVGRSEAPSRVVFGPHETNLGQGRALSDRHVGYYARRAAGGAGVLITETASVAANDWPYERAPLASECRAGWQSVAAACRPFSTVILASLGHAGSQGSSAYSQEVMWAPSRVADVVSREPPAELEQEDIDQIVAAFGQAASLAIDAGVHGVEVDGGPFSLVRQFASGLTNLRSDEYQSDRLLFARQVLAAVRQAIGAEPVLALRLSCDELAPWAGITPDQAEPFVAALARDVDVLTVVRGGPFSTTAYRPDAHTPPNFNVDLCRRMRAAAGGQAQVVLQGSVVDPGDAAQALLDGTCDLVEMTRALIADADLVSRVRAGAADRVRPCLLCNQACRVRDNRNPIVSCVVDPRSGYETVEPEVGVSAGGPVLVVGGGPAGMECARTLAEAGRRVRLVERNRELGGLPIRVAHGVGRERLARASEWLAAECSRLGVDLSLATEASADDVRSAQAEGWQVVLATGGRPLTDRYRVEGGPVVKDPVRLFETGTESDGPVVVDDPVGDWVGIGVAEWLAAGGRQVTLISPDPVAGTQLARTGDLADANGRLQRAGVTRQLRSVVRGAGGGMVETEDPWTGQVSKVPAAVLEDCGHRVPEDALYRQLGDPAVIRVGDCVAPRSILEAILEGRRAAGRV